VVAEGPCVAVELSKQAYLQHVKSVADKMEQRCCDNPT
jgi:hypothetical protein